jgi:hypothetical protein
MGWKELPAGTTYEPLKDQSISPDLWHEFKSPKEAFNALSQTVTYLRLGDGRLLAVQRWEPVSDATEHQSMMIRVKVEGYIFMPKVEG